MDVTFTDFLSIFFISFRTIRTGCNKIYNTICRRIIYFIANAITLKLKFNDQEMAQ